MDKVSEAFQAVDRQDFLPEEVRAHASDDKPFPIGYGQTNSQPSTVRQMLEWLDVYEGQKVLDVGFGSGWTTALLSKLVGKTGEVFAVEIIPELVEFGRDNCEKAGVDNARLFHASESPGLPAHAPYDRILVSASADHIPQELLDQLKTDGILVIPVRSSILVITKAGGELSVDKHPGYTFVPFV